MRNKEVNPYVKLLRNLRLLRAYPLTTKLAEKIEDASEFHGWTIFFNNAHTIAHVMHHDGDGHYRMSCHSTKERRLKQASDDELLLYFVIRLYGKIVL